MVLAPPPAERGAGGAPEPPAPVTFLYTFELSDGTRREFTVALDHGTLEAQDTRGPRPLPAWTALDFEKCPNCPLESSRVPHCPVAASIVDMVECFKDRYSHEQVKVTVEARGRAYVKTTDLQQAISSLLGIYMVTTGCPVMNKLRPMVDTHLPFMSSDESAYRTLSMYLTAQYFRRRNGRLPDWDLDGFIALLEDCRKTNAAFCQRLRSLGIRDSTLNALAQLSAMGEITSLSVETDDLKRLEKIFMRHFDEAP